MRILLLHHRLCYPPDKGEKIHQLWQLRSIVEQHEVDLFTFYDDPNDEKHIPTVAKLCRTCYVERLPWMRARLFALRALLTNKPFTLGYFYSKTMMERVRAAVASSHYDAAVAHCSCMAQYLRPFPHLPRIMDMQDVDSQKWKDYAAESSSPARLLWRLEGQRLADYEAKIAQEFSATILATSQEARILQARAPDAPIRVLTHPTDVAYFNRNMVQVPAELAVRQPLVVLAGSMDYRPNVEGVLYFYHEIFPHIRKAEPNVTFCVAGRNPVKRIQRLASDPAVIVTGAVADIRPYVRAASAAVLPLRVSRGFQNKLLEALSMGVPVIATTSVAKGLPQCVRSVLELEDNPVEFAARVVDIIRNGSQYSPQRLRESVIEGFDNVLLQRKLLYLVDAVVAGRVPGPEFDEAGAEMLSTLESR
jgi:sugar transferase (PEP-CTERM/EpsH1 system associated)